MTNVINVHTDSKEAEFERSKRRWTVRRRLAKCSFVMIIAVIVAGIALVALDRVDADTLMALSAYLATPVLGLFSIIGLYIGFSTKDDMKMAELASTARDVN